MTEPSKSHLRRELRRERRALGPRARRRAAEAMARSLMRSPLYQRALRIGVYLARDGELDPMPLVRDAWRRGKRLYLPVLPPFGGRGLWFRRYQPGTRMRSNRFRIPEPERRRETLSPRQLDLVLMPLVGFDRQGGRLGMGGGFYDRAFAFLHHRRRWQHPRLVGLAYAWQEVDALPREPWDVPMAAVATDTGLRATGLESGTNDNK